jgi:hypothetical protein
MKCDESSSMTNKWQRIAEVFGLLMVAAPPRFFAFQRQKNRTIAEAELNTTQIELFA